jgi:exopolyphosphatase / guanosine-5'-triphosphate,3'-diphosphate pyrophosphatase
MRLGVLDIGSNSAHLQVVDAYPGSPPLPVFRLRTPTRLAEAIDGEGRVDDGGVRRLVTAVGVVAEAARGHNVAELIPFATSAVRDAANRDDIVRRLLAETGIAVGFLSGEEEARLTFFAVHRWLGWSAGPLLMLDIGGGSVEIAYGRDEDPAMVVSLPLGAGLITRTALPDHPATAAQVKAARKHVRDVLQPMTQRMRWEARATRVVATSKTFKQLARLAGGRAGRSDRATLVLRRADLKGLPARLASMTPEQRAALPGVAASRSRQILAGAIVAASLFDALDIAELEVCPWALREGILLRRLSPLLTADSLHQIELIQAAADPDTTQLRRARRVVT